MSTYREGLLAYVEQMRRRADALEDDARRLRKAADAMQADAEALAEEERDVMTELEPGRDCWT